MLLHKIFCTNIFGRVSKRNFQTRSNVRMCGVRRDFVQLFPIQREGFHNIGYPLILENNVLNIYRVEKDVYMGMIKTDKLVFEYIRRDEEGNVEGIQRAVDEVSLEVEAGDFIAILGHNGSGKSTFAKHLNSILLPTEGSVWIDGKDTSKEENIWQVRQISGMVFQNPDNQIIGTVVEEDVGFGPENIGVPTEEIWQRTAESLKAVGMYSYRKMSPNKLSGGQKQRVSIAGIVAMRPKCIILDEPTAMLDPKGRKDVIKTLQALNKLENVTIVLITHYMEEVIEADCVFVMDQGRVAMQGTPREIFSQVEKLRELRMDVPQATLLAYELRKEGYQIPQGILTKEELVEVLCRLY